MSIFNKKGMLVFPNPKEKRKICHEDNLLVFTRCYCPNGHNLVSSNVNFNEFNGILLKISKGVEKGFVALSPVYGCYSKISTGIKLKEGEKYVLSCPECDINFPLYSKCHCGADIFTLFLDKEARFDSFIGACNRIGCSNSHFQIDKEIIVSVRMEAL